MKRERIVVLLIVALLLCGCDITSAAETTEPERLSVPTTVFQNEETSPTGITSPTETTAPIETTEPQQTAPTQPKPQEVEGHIIEIAESVPYYNINSSGCMIVKESQHQDLIVRYAHFNSRLASGGTTYENNVFRVLETGSDGENRSGNRYDLYELRDGSLTKLEEQVFHQEYELFGESFTLELEYATVGAQVMVTYEPETYYDKARACIVNLDKGVHEALARFNFRTGVYYAKVDLETGALTHFLEDLGISNYGLPYPQHTVEKWLDDDSLILRNAGKWSHVDATKQQILEYKPEAGPKRLTIKVKDGMLTVQDHQDNEIILIQLPEQWCEVQRHWNQSKDCRQAVCSMRNEAGIHQILIFDADSNTLYCVARTNSVWKEEMELKVRDGYVFAVSEDGREMCLLLIE